MKVLRYSPKRNQAIHIPTNVDQGNLAGGYEGWCVLHFFVGNFREPLPHSVRAPAAHLVSSLQ